MIKQVGNQSVVEVVDNKKRTKSVLVDMKDSVKTEEVLHQVFKGVVVGDKGEVVVNSKFQRPKRIMIDRQIW